MGIQYHTTNLKMFGKVAFLIAVGILGCTAIPIPQKANDKANEPHDADNEQGIPVPEGTAMQTKCQCRWAAEEKACNPDQNNGSHCWRVCCAKKAEVGVPGLLAEPIPTFKKKKTQQHHTYNKYVG